MESNEEKRYYFFDIQTSPNCWITSGYVIASSKNSAALILMREKGIKETKLIKCTDEMTEKQFHEFCRTAD